MTTTQSTADHTAETDDRFRALLEGLRTSLPGVQVLFAFLLTAPLQSRFADLPDAEKLAFAIAFYASALSSVLLIAPSVHQRVRAPITGVERHSERHLLIATWVTIVGTVLMGIAIVATVYLVSAVVFSRSPALVAIAVLTASIVWSWFYMPLITFARDGGNRER